MSATIVAPLLMVLTRTRRRFDSACAAAGTTKCVFGGDGTATAPAFGEEDDDDDDDEYDAGAVCECWRRARTKGFTVHGDGITRAHKRYSWCPGVGASPVNRFLILNASLPVSRWTRRRSFRRRLCPSVPRQTVHYI